jgi:hypothetical protein
MTGGVENGAAELDNLAVVDEEEGVCLHLTCNKIPV